MSIYVFIDFNSAILNLTRIMVINNNNLTSI